MTATLLSLSVLVAQALPGIEGAGLTIKEIIAVTCALLSVLVVGLWVRSRSSKRK
jgi:hypothetical protein